jgi:hypothetical protein
MDSGSRRAPALPPLPPKRGEREQNTRSTTDYQKQLRTLAFRCIGWLRGLAQQYSDPARRIPVRSVTTQISPRSARKMRAAAPASAASARLVPRGRPGRLIGHLVGQNETVGCTKPGQVRGRSMRRRRTMQRGQADLCNALRSVVMARCLRWSARFLSPDAGRSRTPLCCARGVGTSQRGDSAP